MNGYEEIRDLKGNLLAFTVRNNFSGDKYNFPTSPDNPLQVGVNFYNAGDFVKPHYHNNHERVINITQEFVVVSEGEVKFTVYDNDNQLVNSVTLCSGEAIFFAGGGHRWDFIKKTKILEVKQGPFVSLDQDKTLFDE